jgi:murein DD-endopeptidase MepM/ murein hydrolase activator NlpD
VSKVSTNTLTTFWANFDGGKMNNILFNSSSQQLVSKIVFLPISLLVFVFFFVYFEPSTASQNNPQNTAVLQDFQSLPQPIYNALLATLQNEVANGKLEPRVYGLLSWKQDEEWGIGTVGIRDDLSNSYPPKGSFLIMGRMEGNIWLGVIQSDPRFEIWLNESPETLIAREAIPLIARIPTQSVNQVQGIPLQLRFPWHDNQEWYLGQLGIHGWEGSNNALDFFPNPAIAVAAREVVAAYRGVVIRHCGEPHSPDAQNWVVIQHPDLEGLYATEYLHLDRSVGVPAIGTVINEGQVIGRLLNRTPLPNEPCGEGTGPHVHFGVGTVNSSGHYVGTSIVGTVINGWAVNANSCLTKGELSICSSHPRPSRYFSSSTGAVGGQVYDLSNQPAQGAEVKFSGNALIQRQTNTNATGWYVSPDVPAGLAMITAVKDGSSGSVNMAVVANQSQQAPNIRLLNYCPAPSNTSSVNSTTSDCIPLDHDNALFIADITIPDGSIVSPNQPLLKTWRLRNTGTRAWGSGYQLVFVSGNQMGAPNAVNVPAAAPGNTADISVNLVAPSTPGIYTGYWRLRNPHGTYFGPTIWVQIDVQTSSNQVITVFATDPSSPANTAHVQLYARVENFSNFRAMRLKIDGNVVYEIGAPVLQYNWATNGYALGDHTITVEVADQTDTSWSRPERRSMTYHLLGTSGNVNRAPHRPDPTSPHDWHVYYSGNTAHLCGQHNGDPDGDPITGYYFEIYESAQLWNSGWVSNNCVTTSALGPYNYKWRLRVRDNHGAVSEWSAPRHFTLVNPELTITELYFQPLDSDSERVRIRACTTGQGGVGITLRVSVNDANDGSGNGTWRVLKELGVPCFNEIDAPIWNTLAYGTGSHRVRVEARGNHSSWNGAAVREEVYTLPHRRPQSPGLVAPLPPSGNSNDPIYLNSRTIPFHWNAALRATNYTLHVSSTQSPSDDPAPIFRQVFDSSVTQHAVTFDQDYSILYWQVVATNDKGSTSSGVYRFGIDRMPPSCNIQSLPAVTFENVFQVSWSSLDNSSGTRFTDVQYLDGDRGEWQDWLTLLPATETFRLFNGQDGHAYQFRCRSLDHAGNQGNYSEPSTIVQVDPTARPLEPWWNSAYSQKRSITVLNNATDRSLPVDYPIHIRFDNTTTPSATTIFNGSETAVKCNDLRVVYNNTTELDRYIPVCSPNLIEIWFRNQETIPPATANSTAYRLYYGYADGNNPPDSQTNVWYPLADANTVGLWFLSEGAGSSIADHSGYGNHGNKGTLNWIDSIFGKALASADHSGGNGAFIPGNASMGSSAFTLEFYAKRDDWGGGYIAGMGASGSNRERMRLRVEGVGNIKFQIDPAVGGASDIWGNSICLPNLQWQHIAVTFDGHRAGAVYCGGILAGSGLFNDPGISNLNLDLYLGSDFTTSGRFMGAIDQIRLSNIVRTSFPHAQFANITIPPSLVAGDLIPAPTDAQPDLAIQTIKTYPSSEGGVLVEVVIQNLGTQHTQNGFYTDLYVNHIPTGSGDFTGSIQFWVNEPIEAGATITLTTLLEQLPEYSALHVTSIDQIQEASSILYAQVDSTGVITEPDTQNNIYSAGVDICLASPDPYEGNDSWQEAGQLVLNGSQTHNFHRPGDEDWFAIQVDAGTTYYIRTFNLGPSADTYLYLYSSDGITLLAENDDHNSSLASYIEWTAPSSGQYYLHVRHWNPNVGGCGTNYTISFKDTPFDFIYLPMILR